MGGVEVCVCVCLSLWLPFWFSSINMGNTRRDQTWKICYSQLVACCDLEELKQEGSDQAP